MVANAKRDERYPQYVVRGGNLVDPNSTITTVWTTTARTLLSPIQPCAWSAFDTLIAWVEHGTALPPTHTIPRPPGATADQLAWLRTGQGG